MPLRYTRPLDIESRGRGRGPVRTSVLRVPYELARLGALAVPSAIAEANRRRSGQSFWGGTPAKRPRDSGVMPSRSRSRSRGRTMRRRVSFSRSRSRSRSSFRSSGVASRQRDQSTRYRSRGRRRRGSRFGYRVMNTLLNQQPLQIYTAKGGEDGVSAAGDTSIVGYGIYTTQYSGQADLYNIFVDAGQTLATAANSTTRVYIKSVCLDVQLKNTGAAEIIMDVYEVLNMKDVATTDGIGAQWVTFFNKMTAITAKDDTDVANSLFENPVFCQHYKILSKKEVLILPGEITTMQMRSGKDRMIQGQRVLDYVNSLPRLSRFYIFQWHGGPTTSGVVAATTVSITWQKAYKYAIAPTPIRVSSIHSN